MKRLPWRQFRQSLESDLGSSDEGHWGPDEGPRQLPPPSAVAPVPWSLEVGRNCFWKGRVVASLLTMNRRWRSHRRSQRSPTHPSSGASPLRARARAQLQKEQTFARSACFLHPLAWSTCTQERTAGSPGQLQDYTDPARAHSPWGGRAHSVPQTLQLDPLRHRVINGGFLGGSQAVWCLPAVSEVHLK